MIIKSAGLAGNNNSKKSTFYKSIILALPKRPCYKARSVTRLQTTGASIIHRLLLDIRQYLQFYAICYLLTTFSQTIVVVLHHASVE